MSTNNEAVTFPKGVPVNLIFPDGGINLNLNINLTVTDDRAVTGLLQQILDQQKESKTNMSQISDDLAELHTDVGANTTAINSFVAIHKADTDTIASLTKQIADLKAANPAIDVTGLEADIAALKANNTAANAIVPPPAS